jgi:hypothetical protein
MHVIIKSKYVTIILLSLHHCRLTTLIKQLNLAIFWSMFVHISHLHADWAGLFDVGCSRRRVKVCKVLLRAEVSVLSFVSALYFGFLFLWLVYIWKPLMKYIYVIKHSVCRQMDVNKRCNKGDTPLSHACSRGKDNVVKYGLYYIISIYVTQYIISCFTQKNAVLFLCIHVNVCLGYCYNIRLTRWLKMRNHKLRWWSHLWSSVRYCKLVTMNFINISSFVKCTVAAC